MVSGRRKKEEEEERTRVKTIVNEYRVAHATRPYQKSHVKERISSVKNVFKMQLNISDAKTGEEILLDKEETEEAIAEVRNHQNWNVQRNIIPKTLLKKYSTKKIVKEFKQRILL